MSAASGDPAPRMGLRERVPFYAVASRLLLHEVDEAFYAVLTVPPVRTLWVGLDAGCEAWFAQPWEEAFAAALREEYARLFVLPSGTPPFASAWLEGDRDALGAQVHGLVTSALEALGREPRVAEPWGRVPLDHLGLLFDLVVTAVEQGGLAGFEVAQHLDRELLGPWLGRFGDALAREAALPVYRGLGRLLVDLEGA